MREQARAEHILLEDPGVRDVVGLQFLDGLLDVVLQVLAELGHDLVLGMGQPPDAVLVVSVDDHVELAVLKEADAPGYVRRKGFAVACAAAHQSLDVYEIPEVDALRSWAFAELAHELDDGLPRHRVNVMPVRAGHRREPLPLPGDVHRYRLIDWVNLRAH